MDEMLLYQIGVKTSRRIGVLLLAAVLTQAIPAVAANSASATMQVSVQVIERAIVTVEGQVSTVTVSDADVARGYVDVADPILVRVRTNSRRGYLLTVDNLSGQFTSVELSSPDVSMNVSAQSFLERPYVSGGDVISMHARLRLARGTRAGSVPVAIAFNASPL